MKEFKIQSNKNTKWTYKVVFRFYDCRFHLPQDQHNASILFYSLLISNQALQNVNLKAMYQTKQGKSKLGKERQKGGSMKKYIELR